MNLTYRLPNLNIWEQYTPDLCLMPHNEMLRYVSTKFSNEFHSIQEWLDRSVRTLPELSLRAEKVYPTDSIHLYIDFTLPEKEAIMFKLRFGEGWTE